DPLLTSMKSGAVMPDSLVYDTACTLRLHWNNVFNTNYMKRTELTEKLYNLRLVIDRFHQKGHKRQMCKQFMNSNYDPCISESIDYELANENSIEAEEEEPQETYPEDYQQDHEEDHEEAH
ncbi:unnamed protein product, partial [Rotaria sp. Silwood1]